MGAKLGCGVCAIVTITVAILVAVSIKSLAPNEVGLDYSANSLTLDTSKLFGAGPHFLGVGHSFIVYPKSVQEIDMRSDKDMIIGRTKDGLVIKLQTRLLYRLMGTKERLASLYLMFKEEYPTAYRSITRGTVRDVASLYTAFEFWQQRDNITQVMRQELTTKLADVHASVDDFLIPFFSLPSAFDDALTQTDVWQQEKSKVAYEMGTAEQQIQTALRTSNVTVDRMLLEAERVANTTTFEFEAEVQRINASVAAEVNGYGVLQSELGLTQEQLVNLVWLRALQATKAPKTFNVQVPATLDL